MPRAISYHRPGSVHDAISLLVNNDHLPLAGGTVLNADDDPTLVSFVDLQECGLANIDEVGSRLRLGAMLTLHDLTTDSRVPVGLANAARAELPSTLRTLATIGGTVATRHADSVLLAALLVYEACVTVAGPNEESVVPLAELLHNGVDKGHLVVALDVETSGTCVRHATSRTPADTPIVSATARATDESAWLALTGVAAHPVLANPKDPTTDIAPIGDFRGSAEYRRRLSKILSSRALAEARKFA
ncbi:MAG: FAD binding domain-containing protein [Acidimicrobiales bacterium]|nr:FAD binding domain-containing protein [Acidimicrobiales bacterium]